ncbi:MAG: diaminopimelate decarboxylase [Ruminobacter sp.]|jgi:diaminopimelate decarboxylase|nr:diaminopimelate decarboxylase [Ruminobacter sp.]MBR1925084.1 diaminopimelate decarboxylase [Ruminobacter sp.]
MNFIDTKDNGLVAVEDLYVKDLAQKYGTPLYVYSKAQLVEHLRAYNEASGNVEHLVCYAVKANSNLAILQLMASLGTGFDIVSGGELARVIEAGGDPRKVVYSGVAKSVNEIEYALSQNILCFNVESPAELERINQIALDKGVKAPISIRVNPDVDAGTHPYISTGLKNNKFGVPVNTAFELYKHALTLDGIQIKGIDCHIGSQLTTLNPFVDALDRILNLVDRLADAGVKLEHIDIGGGLGVVYNDETPPSVSDYLKVVTQKLAGRGLKLICEPGRSMVANAGILVTRCEYLKQGEVCNFCIVDAAMNDMIRPSLYSAWMRIEEADHSLDREVAKYNVVGPICETGDFLGKDRVLKVASGDFLVMHGAGAYGFAMSSNYNSRPRSAEIMVDGSVSHIIRDRESVEDLWRHEHKIN